MRMIVDENTTASVVSAVKGSRLFSSMVKNTSLPSHTM